MQKNSLVTPAAIYIFVLSTGPGSVLGEAVFGDRAASAIYASRSEVNGIEKRIQTLLPIPVGHTVTNSSEIDVQAALTWRGADIPISRV